MSKPSITVEHRLAATDRLHQLSYQVVSHYDSKTNQLLTIIGINFAIVGIILAGFFAGIDRLSAAVRVFVLLYSVINFLFLIISLWHVIKALTPHLSKVGQHPKLKLGLTYFKDILKRFNEEEYVQIFLCRIPAPESPYVNNETPSSLLESLIEDNCRDIYAHAEILDVKTTAVSKAFACVFCTMLVLCITTVLLGLVYSASVPQSPNTPTGTAGAAAIVTDVSKPRIEL